MFRIYYWPVFMAFTVLWVLTRVGISFRRGRISWKREFQMLLVYICIVVVARFTFFPFFKVEGKIRPLLFDAAKMFPPRINLIPVVYLFDYPVFREALINFLGNSFMFLPLGIVWPVAFRKLDSHWKVIAAGAGTSLLIEILQLPFFDRVSDVDDLILNTTGYLAGYGIYLLVRGISRFCKRRRGKK